MYSQLKDTTLALEVKAGALISTKKYDEALIVCNIILKIKPKSIMAIYTKGNIATYNKQYKTALSFYDMALVIDSKYTDAWNGKGNIFGYFLEQYSDALYCYNQALAVDCKNAYVLYNKAHMLSKLDKYEEAIESYKLFIKHATSFHSSNISRATNLIQELELKIRN